MRPMLGLLHWSLLRSWPQLTFPLSYRVTWSFVASTPTAVAEQGRLWHGRRGTLGHCSLALARNIV